MIMGKVIIALCLLVFIQITGYISTEANSSSNGIKAIETKSKKSESDIRKIAYQCLNEYDKKSIIRWQSAKVEEYTSKTDHSIWATNKTVNIKGKDTYKVTFRTNNENLVGLISIYIDINSYKVLGQDLRG
jgi:hypothetical protein